MHAPTSNPNPTTAVKALEFLAFTLGHEEYGIDIQGSVALSVFRNFDTP